MAGSANTPPSATSGEHGSDAVMQIAGTGTGNDSRWVRGFQIWDGATGAVFTSSNPMPVIDQGALAASTDNVAIAGNSATGATTYGFRNSVTFTTQTIKASAGTLYALEITNASGAAAFVSVFDSAAPTLGTTVPRVYVTLATATSVTIPMGSPGRAFTTAMTVFSATTDNGSTGSAAGVTITAAYV